MLFYHFGVLQKLQHKNIQKAYNLFEKQQGKQYIMVLESTDPFMNNLDSNCMSEYHIARFAM